MSLVRKIIKHRSPMQNEKSQPSGQRIIPETRQTSFPALSVDPRAGITPSASETDDRVYFFLAATADPATMSFYLQTGSDEEIVAGHIWFPRL